MDDDFEKLASSFLESVRATDNKASLIEVAKNVSSLFGELEESQKVTTQQDRQHQERQHQEINAAMKIGQVAQPLIARRADVHVSLKALFIKHLHALFKQAGGDDSTLNLDNLTPDAITIITNPGIFILPEIQSMAATPDMLMEFGDVRMTIEIKTTGHYAAAGKELNVYLPQCQMQILCTGAVGGFLLLANSTSMTLNNVKELALICDTNIHLIPLRNEWQNQAMVSCKFARALSELALPQLYNQVIAPNNFSKALLHLPGAVGTVLTRVGRTLRLSGCEACLLFKHVSFPRLIGGTGIEYPHVRASHLINAAAANAIHLRINQRNETGFYLIASQQEHSGCPTPISTDKRYSPKEWSDILDDIADLSKKGVSAGNLTMHLQEKYGLKKTTQDVTNLLSKMETVRLVNEQKVLPTNAAKLIDALDTMPVVSIGLYSIVKCDAAHTLVMQIIRVKGFANNEARISYVEYKSWAILQAWIPHSLLQLLEDPTLPFIGTHPNLIQGTLTTPLTPLPYYTRVLVVALYLLHPSCPHA